MPISRAQIIRPGAPLSVWTISSDPFSFQFGAVHFPSSSFMLGPSGRPPTLPLSDFFQFTQGVLSFWARFDPTISTSGDSAKIAQTTNPHSAMESNTALTTCMTNAPINPPGFGSLFRMGCVAFFIDILGAHVALVDTNTSNGLIGASLTYNNLNSATFPVVWQNLGNVASQLHETPFTFNGNSFAGLGSFIMPFPCGGGAAVTFNGTPTQQVCNFSDASQLPTPTAQMLGEVVLVGPTTFQMVPVENFIGDCWSVTSSIAGGTNPTSGWHHYICSFDTSQLVTDVNGNQSIRVQIAMDGAGGPLGGPLMDTKATSITLASQPFSSWSTQGGITGTLSVASNDTWVIESPSDASVDFAYCYFGVSLEGEGFYDLTNVANMRRFLSATGKPVSFGESAQNIPLDPIFMHTGDMGVGNLGTTINPISSAFFPTNAVEPFTARNPSPAPGTSFVPWRTFGGLTSTDGPAH